MIVVIAARLVSIEDRGHECTIKPQAANLHYPSVADSGRDFYRGGADQYFWHQFTQALASNPRCIRDFRRRSRDRFLRTVGSFPRRQHSRAPGGPFRLYTVSDTTSPIHAGGGMQVIPDYTFANAPTPKVIVIPA